MGKTVGGSFTPSVPPPVGWVSFQPLQANTVTWTAQYYLYASATGATTGLPITMNARTGAPAQPGWLYPFAQGHFTGVPAANVRNQTRRPPG